ncbi:MAG: insulinase family protein [Planctomycetes bacterium]|nr:insulinase family protein [Planctomycetota bacterium]
MSADRALGLRLPHVHRAAVVVLLRGGPRHEGPREGGLTHLLEHMLFRGAGPHATARDLLAAFEDLGEEPDAYTCDDALGLAVEVDPARVDAAVRLLGHVLLRPRYRDLERERAVVLEERLGLVDEDGRPTDPDDVARAVAFPGHGLARPVVGEERDILRFGRRDLERLRGRLVRRGNAAVVVAGPLPEARATRAARRLLAALPAGPALEGEPLPPPRGPRTGWQPASGSPQTDLRLTFRGPGLRDPRAPALGVLADVLDGGAVSRLPLRLVDAGLAYDAWADVVAFPDISLLEVQVTLAHDKLPRAAAETLRLLSGLARVVPDEVRRAAERRRHAARRWRDDPREQAEWHARRLLFDLPADREAEEARADAVRARDVAALAREVVRPERLSAVLVGAPPARARRAARQALERWVRRSRAV